MKKTLKKPEYYFSFDVETDGPCPGMHSLLSMGCVAFDENGNEVGEWYANFELMENGIEDPATMKFWSENQKYYDATRTWIQHPQEAMTNFAMWVASLDCIPVCVAMPAGFDFSWLWYYCRRYLNYCPFSFSCIDMKTMAWVMLGGNLYRESTKKNWPKQWFSPFKHTHHALDDAREQGHTFMNMLKDLKSRN